MSDYDVTIEKKGKDDLKFNLCDHRGRPSRARGAFRMAQFPQLAMKMQQGNTVHEDREPPYASREQLDFSGGRGWDDLERDKSRFYDSYRAQTWRDGIVLLGPEETYAEGIRAASFEHWFDDNVDANDDMHRLVLDGATEYYSYKFVPAADFTAAHIYLASGADYTHFWHLVADIYSDAAGEPDASIATTGDQRPVSYEQIHRFEFETPVALTNGVTYHVVVRNYENPVVSWSEEGFYVMAAETVAASTAYKSVDGATWAAADYGIFFRLVAADSEFDIFPFEHLGALYMALSFRDGSAPKVYMNGERGTVTSATSTTLTDSAAAFTVDDLIGAIVVLYSGIGAEAERPWRSISDNTGTEITVSEAWDVTPSENTKYVVVQRDKFTEVTGHEMTGRITDVMTFGNIVYFCKGDYDQLYHMYNDVFDYEDDNKGSFIIVAPDSANVVPKVYLARASFPPTIVTASPVYADDDYAVEDLVFTYAVTVGDAAMGRNDGSWVNYGTLNSHVRSEFALSGRYSRYLDTGAVDSGATQDVTVEDATYYKITVHVYLTTAVDASVKLEFEGVELASTSVKTQWVRLTGYGLSVGVAGTLRFLSKGGFQKFYYDCVSMEKVETGLPFGHNRITKMLVAGDPKRLYVITDAGMLKEENGKYLDVSPSELVNVRDMRNGQAAISKGQYIYFNFLDSLVKYYDEEISLLGPNLDAGLPADRRGEIRDIVSYGEWVLCAIDGGKDNVSSILLYNGIGWHEFYRAPAVGLRITKMWIQSIPGNYIDRLWFNEGADIVWLGIDLTPEMNANYRYSFAGWIDQANVYGSMGEVEKFFQAIKVTANDLAATHYISTAPRRESGWRNEEPPAGEIIQSLWGIFVSSPVDEIAIEAYWGMDAFTLRRLQIHIGLHTTRPVLTPDLRAMVVDFIEHIPISWGYTLRLMTQDSRRSLTGERMRDVIEDDIVTLKGWVDSGGPVRIFTPFSYANNLTVKLTGINDIEPVGYTRRDDRERAMFILSAVDA